MPRCRGFRISDYLVALVVVPLVSLVILHRWMKNRAARKEEIKKLLIFAAEEAARAEAEATAFYYCSSAAVETKPQCVVCFSPTTTRCSRCKAVRYCSGKCQIIHWRQGHKYDCHPPDIDDLNASAHYVSTYSRELSSDSFTEPCNISSYEGNDGSRNSDTIIENVNEPISEKLKFPASKRSEDLASSAGPEVANEKLDPDDVSHEILDFCVQSSTANTMHMTPSKDEPAHDVFASEASAPETHVNCSEYSDSLRSGICNSESVVTDVPDDKTDENDVSFSTSVNNVLNPEVSTSHLPELKNGKNNVPVSGDILGPNNFEHNTHSSASYTIDPPISMDMSGIAGAGNNLPISKDHEHENFASERVQYSSISSSHDINGSKSFRLTPTSNGNMGDTSKILKRSSSTSKIIVDATTSKSSVKNATNQTNGHKGDTSMAFHRSSSTSKNVVVGSTTKSAMKIASNARDLVSSLSGQKISGSLFSSSKSSSQTKDSSSFTGSVSQGPTSNVATTQMAAPKIDNQKASDLNGSSRRSGRPTLQQHSPLNERASVRSTSRLKNGNYETVSSNAFHSVVSSLSTGFVLKASVRKVAQQLKGSKVSKQDSSRIINDDAVKSSKTLFPYESFVKLFNCDKLELPPCGLINCGNSCYANVVLQCLVFTRPIAAYLLHGSHSKTCQRSRRNDWCFMCELQHLVYRMRDGKSPISPIRILSQLKNIGNHLGYGREEDAHEFLRFVTEALQSVCLAEVGSERSIDSKLQETTLIQQIFTGSLYSKIKCLKCHYISERYDAIMDLMVEIDNEDIESLEDALAGFTAPEILDGAEKYYCGRCKTLMKAKKQLAVHEAPNILTIVLKRFQNGKFGKLNKRVSFPEILNMKPYMTGMGDKPPAYKLYAVVVHLDMMNASFSGHYVCYAKNLEGAWYKINDCKVKQVGLDKVLSQRAYMLFYSRSSPRPPSILENGIAPSSMPVDSSSLANASKKPVLKHGFEKISILETSPATSCTVDLEEYGFLNRVPSGRGNRIIGARDYMDWASSDSGSLFSNSDEASCSTESNRDSTSTDDYNETILGDAGGPTCTSSGLPEDPYTLPSSFFHMKSSPPPLTEYYSQNNTYFQDSAFSNQYPYGDTYHHNREIDPATLSSPDPTSQVTDGLPAWLSSNASSYFFPPSVPFDQRDSSSFDSDPSSTCSYSLDFRTSNTNKHADFSYSRSSNGAPVVSESGAHRQEDFAATARSRPLDQKCMPGFLHESARSNFDVPSFNAATNLDDCLLHDARISDTLTAQPLGHGR